MPLVAGSACPLTGFETVRQPLKPDAVSSTFQEAGFAFTYD